jgi:hypothetical protein
MSSYIGDRVADVMDRHGQTMTLKRRTDVGFDQLLVKGRIFNPRLQPADLDGEAGTTQRIRISNAEIAASVLPDLMPTEKDQIVVDGHALSIEAVNTLRDGETIVCHVLEVIGIGA